MPKKISHTPRRSHTPWGLIFILAVVIFIWGCAAGHYEFYNDLKNFMTRGEYQQADKTIQQNQARVYGDKDLLLYYFDRGWLLHLAGQWNESNRMFALAEQLADSYFTKSISTEASTFLISDNMRPYYGEDFERAMIHVFSALNYIYLNKFDDALVEARRVDLFLTKLQTDYGYQNYYNEDAFIRYLMGIIYESQGEINDAFISYRKALETYKATENVYKVKVPEDLVFSALQTATDMGFTREFGEIKDDFPELSKNFVPEKSRSADGEIIFLHYNGRVPHKVDNIFKFAFGNAWGYVGMVEVDGKTKEDVYNAGTVIESIASEEQINVAFPKFVPTGYDILLSMLEVNGQKYQTELVDDIGEIAVKNLADRQGRVFFKSVARAAVKFALTKVAERKIEKETKNEVAQWVLKSAVKTTAALTEKADKRSWQTLPDQIRMSRIRLPQGIYSLKVSFIDRRGYVAREKKLDNIKVIRGKKTFVYVSSVE
jgi:uncharacterized protein